MWDQGQGAFLVRMRVPNRLLPLHLSMLLVLKPAQNGGERENRLEGKEGRGFAEGRKESGGVQSVVAFISVLKPPLLPLHPSMLLVLKPAHGGGEENTW